MTPWAPLVKHGDSQTRDHTLALSERHSVTHTPSQSFFSRIAEQEGLEQRLKERVAKFKRCVCKNSAAAVAASPAADIHAADHTVATPRHLSAHFKWEFGGATEDDPVMVETAPDAAAAAPPPHSDGTAMEVETPAAAQAAPAAQDAGDHETAAAAPSSFYKVFKY